MPQYNVTLTFTVHAGSDDEAREMGIAIADHVHDTFNDNDSISPLYALTVECADDWFVGATGHWFFDTREFRYSVSIDSEDSYTVSRDGYSIHTRIPSLSAAKLLAQADGRIHKGTK